MSKNNHHGFFTGRRPDEYDLPHPRLDLPVILLIRRVMCRAFEMLRDEGVSLATAGEDTITARLLSVIENNLRQSGRVAGFNCKNYERVNRQSEVSNYDGTKIRKAPDLCFRLRHDDGAQRRILSEFDGLFVECKPVDKKHAAGSSYCSDGLIRFVNGDYAWAMEQAMMLAYARDSRTISDHLIPAMKSLNTLETIQHPVRCKANAAAAEPGAEALYITKHHRRFSWLNGKGPATDVTVYHLWHDCG